jgi:hypothetical protein
MQATEYVIVPEGCKPGVRIYIYSPLFGARLATQSILCFGFKWHFPPFACTHAPASLGWGEFHHNKMQKSICRRTLHFCRFPVFGGAPHDFFEAEIYTQHIFIYLSAACHEICCKIFTAPSVAPVSLPIQPNSRRTLI